jgi:glycosyltransferase involved in cell wall biosynthesis
MSRKVRIISKSNGVGLTRDIKLLANCLQQAGYDVLVHSISIPEARHRRSMLRQSLAYLQLKSPWSGSAAQSDGVYLNVMLEHVWPEFLPRASRNVVVPNPEWFDRNDLRFLPEVDCVWAKTRETERTFARLGCRTRFISFDSDDRYDVNVPSELRFFHLAGMSTMKGTARLVRAWVRRPHWPTLTIVQHSADLHAPEARAPNLDRRCGYIDDTQLRWEQNACRFHICPSLTEGWGHYIAEALSVGAVTLTVDAPPMNELVTEDRGLLMRYQDTGTQRLAKTYQFRETELQAAVEHATAMSNERWSRLSAHARAWFEENSGGFQSRVQAAMRAMVEDFP